MGIKDLTDYLPLGKRYYGTEIDEIVPVWWDQEKDHRLEAGDILLVHGHGGQYDDKISDNLGQQCTAKAV